MFVNVQTVVSPEVMEIPDTLSPAEVPVAVGLGEVCSHCALLVPAGGCCRDFLHTVVGSRKRWPRRFSTFAVVSVGAHSDHGCGIYGERKRETAGLEHQCFSTRNPAPGVTTQSIAAW